MAPEKLFKSIPPFSDDVAVVDMACLRLKGLETGDEPSHKQMITSCQELGFFLLDLRGGELGNKVIDETDKLFKATEELMALPEEEKLAFQNEPGKNPLGTETQQPDRFQWFNLAQDDLLGNTPLQPLPDLMLSYRDLFASFVRHGEVIVSTICKILAVQLDLPINIFTSRQPLSKPSGTVLRFIKVDASPNEEDLRTCMVHHTNFGTITLLANVRGGLQVLAPGASPMDASSWLWVRPQPGCLVVNVGDEMVKWTGGLLRSNMHRVNYAPGKQRFVDRCSVALLVRPEKKASMKTLIGSPMGDDEDDMTAYEWEMKRGLALTKGERQESEGGIISNGS